MDKDYATLPITFERGLLESVEDAMLPPGSCAKLENWAQDPAGNLRPRVGWLNTSTTSAPSTRQGWGIGHLHKPRRPYVVQHEAVEVHSSSTTSLVPTPAWPQATVAGNLLVCHVGVECSNGLIASGGGSTTISGLSGWTFAGYGCPGPRSIPIAGTDSEYIYTWLYYKQNAASTSGNLPVTVTFPGTKSDVVATAQIFELANIATSDALDTYGFLSSNENTTTITWASANQYTATANSSTNLITDTAHGLSTGDPIVFGKHQMDGSSSLPSPLTENTTYYVLWNAADTFYVTSQIGGTAIDLTTNGSSFGYGRVRECPVGYALMTSSGWAQTNVSIVTTTRTFSNPSEGTVLLDQAAGVSGSYALSSWSAGRPIDDPNYPTVSGTLAMSAAAGALHNAGGTAIFKAADYTATDQHFVVANKEGTTTLKIYYLDDLSGSTGWTLLETLSVSPDVVPVAFTSGNDFLLYTHPSFTGTRKWAGVGFTPEVIEGSPAGRCIAWHKERLFVGGTNANPWRLYWSGVGDEDTWTGGTSGYVNVGLGDGEAIEDIAPFEDALLIGKQTSVWLLTGSGPDSFRLVKLPTGVGVAPGRTITPTSQGAMLAGRDTLQLYGGGRVELLSKVIRDSYGMTGNWMSGAVVDDKYYILDEGSGTVWCLDLQEWSWTTEVVDDTDEAPACLYNIGSKLLGAPSNASVGSLLFYRSEPGSAREKDFNGVSTSYEAWTPEMWPVGPEEKITPRWLFLKLGQRGYGPAENPLVITPYYDGEAATAREIQPRADSAGTYWASISLGEKKGISSIQFRITHVAEDGQNVTWDLDEVTLGFYIESVR